jgi:predicted dehydrogenase
VRPTLGVGVIGFGWMGRAHSRSVRRIPSLFPDRVADPVLVACSDTVAARRTEAVDGFGFGEAVEDWRAVVDHPGVDVVFITAPNMFHVEMVEAAAAAGTHVFCEKPVGGTPAQTVAAERAARRAGVVTGVGYNYRWAPLVQHAKALIADGRLGRITNFRGRFLSCYGSDPLGVRSWRYLVDEGGYGVSTDLLSHVLDLAHFLVGPITSVVGTGETFITERPLPMPGTGTHYDRGRAGDPTGPVTNEDWFGGVARFADGAVGTFEASRTMTGPESQHAVEVYGQQGALAWNFERMNELELHLPSEGPETGWTTVLAGEQFGHHGRFVPGRANGIGFEDLVTIEDHEFLAAVARKEAFVPGFAEAVAYVSVQDALLRSWESGRWEPVVALGEEPA